MKIITQHLKNSYSLLWKLISSSSIKSFQLAGGKAVQYWVRHWGCDLYLHVVLWKYTSASDEMGPKHWVSCCLPGPDLWPQAFNNSMSAWSWQTTCPEILATMKRVKRNGRNGLLCLQWHASKTGVNMFLQRSHNDFLLWIRLLGLERWLLV